MARTRAARRGVQQRLPRLLLFDFGNTLADQEWMTRIGVHISGWEQIYNREVRTDGQRWSAWRSGVISCEDVAEHLGRCLHIDSQLVLAHFQRACALIDLDNGLTQLARDARRQGIKTGIVTINADVFSRFIVPALRLHDDFAPIVCSSDHGILKKPALCQLAAHQAHVPIDETMLIDDNQRHLAAFRAIGGRAQHYRTGQGAGPHRISELRGLILGGTSMGSSPAKRASTRYE